MQTGEMEKVLEAIERFYRKEEERYINQHNRGSSKANEVSVQTNSSYSVDMTD
jgi:hypothetical protein